MTHVASIKSIVDNAFLKVINRNKFLTAAEITNTSLQSALKDAIANTSRREQPSRAILAQADSFEMKASLEEIGLRVAGDHLDRNEQAKSGLDRAQEILTELNTKADEAAANGTSGPRRVELNDEAQVLVSELNSIINTTRYNGRKVLEGQNTSFRMGDDNISYKDSRVDTVTSALGSIDLTKKNDAKDALDQIKLADDQLNLELVNVNHNIDMIGRAMEVGNEEAENLFASATSIRIDAYDVVDDVL